MTAPEPPRLRAADTDRQAVVERLAAHFTAGRLTASEYDERVRQAYASTYLDELPTLLADLPEDEVRGRGRRGNDGADLGPAAGYGGDEDRWQGASRWIGRDDWQGQGPPWRGRPGGYRHRPPIAVLPLVLVLVLVLALSHGFVLIPLIWIGVAMLAITRHGRRRGGCGGPIRYRTVR